MKKNTLSPVHFFWTRPLWCLIVTTTLLLYPTTTTANTSNDHRPTNDAILLFGDLVKFNLYYAPATVRPENVPATHNIQCHILGNCIPCPIDDNNKPKHNASRRDRKRKELRDLTTAEWDAFVFALWTMKNLTMAEGQERYGPLFKTYDYFVLQHAVAVESVLGNQAHWGAHFMSFHSTFLQQMETTLLTVTSTEGLPLEGLPYWWNLDDPSPDILSTDFFGTHPGQGERHEITDGAFAYWPIANFTTLQESEYKDYVVNPVDNKYTKGNSAGLLRGFYNDMDTPFHVAFPIFTPNGTRKPYQGFSYEKVKACLQTPYHPTEFTIYNFTDCIDDFRDGFLSSWHTRTHIELGGNLDQRDPKFRPGWTDWFYAVGDLMDTITSPNAPIFFPFHATLDMFTREWASRHKAYANVTWGFPYRNGFNNLLSFDNRTYGGINGNDTISGAFPFYWQDVGWASVGTPEGRYQVTHAQAHCRFAKENVPYVYVRYSGAPDDAPGESESEEASSGSTSHRSVSRRSWLAVMVVRLSLVLWS